MSRFQTRTRVAAATIALTLVLTGAGCGESGGVSVDIPTAPMADAAASEVDRTVRQIWEPQRENLPALYVGIWDPQRGVFTKAYGEAAPGTAATTNDSFRIGSISKTFTAIAVLRLIADGRLSLDDTIETAAPAVARRYPKVSGRTVRQLLDMHSGISDYINPTDGVVKAIVTDPERVWTADDLIAQGIALGVAPAGGTPGSYSTTNYILLQEIAESVSGAELRELIRRDVTEPLGLDATFLPPNDDTALPDPAAESRVTPSCRTEFINSGGDVAVGTDVTDWSASYGQGGGGMTSTLDDLGRWAASGTGDALLPADLVTERNRMAPLGEVPGYGLGVLEIGQWVGHEGEALGWETFALTNPTSGVSIALASNSCGVVGSYAEIIGALYPETLG